MIFLGRRRRWPAGGLRAKIESPPVGMSTDIFYHSEPFDVACDIVGKQKDSSRVRKKYDEILTNRDW